jgi:hypothetical protein
MVYLLLLPVYGGVFLDYLSLSVDNPLVLKVLRAVYPILQIGQPEGQIIMRKRHSVNALIPNARPFLGRWVILHLDTPITIVSLVNWVNYSESEKMNFAW